MCPQWTNSTDPVHGTGPLNNLLCLILDELPDEDVDSKGAFVFSSSPLFWFWQRVRAFCCRSALFLVKSIVWGFDFSVANV